MRRSLGFRNSNYLLPVRLGRRRASPEPREAPAWPAAAAAWPVAAAWPAAA